MALLHSALHKSLLQLTRKSHGEFLRQRKDLRGVQESILRRLLAQSRLTTWGREHGVSQITSYADFQRRLAPSTWEDWRPWVELERASERALCGELKRYQPTSGSGAERKWIPYTKSFLAELDRATAPWMHDLYLRHRALRRGRHYWSLSWLPTELRGQMSNDDLSYFPQLERLILGPLMAVPRQVQEAPTAELARQQTLAALLECADLSFVSVWSPTFLLALCRDLLEARESFAARASVRVRKILLAQLPPEEIFAQLWPALSVISCWQTAEAARWIPRLKELFPRATIESKGLFATEGVVTIPIAGKMTLAYRSHFYEFERDDGKIVPAWELVPGQRVRVLLTTGSGFMRYQLGDEMQVQELVEGCPTLEFLGRRSTSDLVGEKLSYESARKVLAELGDEALFFLASPGDREKPPAYELVWQGSAPARATQLAEEALGRHHHYKLARELNQLAPVSVRAVSDVADFLRSLCETQGWVEGDRKWEAVVRLNRPMEN